MLYFTGVVKCRYMFRMLQFLFHIFLLSEPPTFVKLLSPLEVVNGSNAYFECQVKGTAPFEVTWQKDSNEIKLSLKHVIMQKNGSIMTLDVQKCDALDVGEYQCIVANEVGSCSSQTTLSIKG